MEVLGGRGRGNGQLMLTIYSVCIGVSTNTYITTYTYCVTVILKNTLHTHNAILNTYSLHDSI